jgi:hypothetical protein
MEEKKAKIKIAGSSLVKTLTTLVLVAIVIIGFLYTKTQDPNNQLKNKYKDAQIIIDEFAIFSTQTVPIKERTQIKISFVPPENSTEVWLSLDLNGNKNKNILISHPTLNELDWSRIGNLSYTLFQKNQQFENVEDFLKNPPKDSHIQADPQLIEEGLISVELASPLEFDINVDEVDYILTTYRPHYLEDDYHIYETVIDATQALETDGQLSWAFYMKNVSQENPFILKGVNINYSQPAQIQ